MHGMQLFQKSVASDLPLTEVELRQLGANERFFYADFASQRGFALPNWFLQLLAAENPLAANHFGTATTMRRETPRIIQQHRAA